MLTTEQLSTYRSQGYVVVPAPWPASLSNECLAAYERLIGMPAQTPASDAEMGSLPPSISNFRLRPDAEGWWGSLDHSLPFLNIELHPSVVAIARQLDGDDIYFRNGGINEIAPGRAVRWHRDSSSKAHFEADGVIGEDVEFMHYFHGSPREGGFRVWPASHQGSWDEWQAEVSRQRAAQAGTPSAEQLAEPFLRGVNDAQLPGEVILHLGPSDLLIRSSRVVHGTWRNDCGHGRLMHQWRFSPADVDVHRIRFEEHMSNDLLRALSPEQKAVLWVGRRFDIAPRYAAEDERRRGQLLWGVDGTRPPAATAKL